MKMLKSALLAAALALVVAGAPAEAAPDQRVALVIGNSAYRNAPALANPERDARAISTKLKGIGFSVIEGYDLDQRGFQRTVQDFARASKGADVALFYYASHGVQVAGQNYAVPVDAIFQDSTALDFETIPIDLVMRQMQSEDGVRLVVLDACRDNPLSRSLARSMGSASRSTAVGTGLADVKIADPGRGTAIIFATSPNEVALDGDGAHSPFTRAFLDHMDAPGLDLGLMVARVTGDVITATNKQQRPWMNASLTGAVYLNPTTPGGPAVAAIQPAAATPVVDAAGDAREKSLYAVAQQSGLAEDYRAYLETFPTGLFAANARNHIARLERDKPAGPMLASVSPEPAPERAVAPVVELPVTDAVKAMAGTKTTEAALEFSKDKRREVQTRLKALSYDPGPQNGVFAAKTRAAIENWQASIGVPVTGYLNQPQYEIMVQRSEPAMASLQPAETRSLAPEGAAPAKRKAAAKPAPRAAQSSRPVREQRRQGRDANEMGLRIMERMLNRMF